MYKPVSGAIFDLFLHRDGMNYKQILFFTYLILCFQSAVCYSQKKGFTSGYVITLQGDTCRGYLQDRSAEPFTALYTKIRFQKIDSKKIEKFAPNEIRGYHIDGVTFHSFAIREIQEFLKVKYLVSNGPSNVFLKVISESKSLVYYQKEYIHDDNFYLDFVPLFYRPGKKDLVRVTQGILGLKKKVLGEYFPDCPKLVDEINKDKTSLKTPDDVYQFYHENCLSELK